MATTKNAKKKKATKKTSAEGEEPTATETMAAAAGVDGDAQPEGETPTDPAPEGESAPKKTKKTRAKTTKKTGRKGGPGRKRINWIDGFSGADIKRIRKDKGVSRGALATILDCSVATLTNWENGKSVPTIDKQRMIVQRLKGQGATGLPRKPSVRSMAEPETPAPAALPSHAGNGAMTADAVQRINETVQGIMSACLAVQRDLMIVLMRQ